MGKSIIPTDDISKIGIKVVEQAVEVADKMVDKLSPEQMENIVIEGLHTTGNVVLKLGITGILGIVVLGAAVIIVPNRYQNVTMKFGQAEINKTGLETNEPPNKRTKKTDKIQKDDNQE